MASSAAPDGLIVEDGRVICPVRGPRDVEGCFRCQSLVRANLQGSPPTIVCRSSGARIGRDALFPPLRWG